MQPDQRLFADRLVVLDTETTGFDPAQGDRIVEIGLVELVRCLPSGRELQLYVNPGRPSHPRALEVHGLTCSFLADKPVFAAVAHELIDFIGDSAFVAHNAQFDLGFLNAELARCGLPRLPPTRAICSAELARTRFPGAPVTLDNLCDRFGIDRSTRVKHGAVIDCRLLAEVYLELIGGRQIGLALATPAAARESDPSTADAAPRRPLARQPRPHAPSKVELEAHARFLATVTDPIWHRAPTATI
ncbi:MAG: DNA polymerase III subunit epsilon [Sphingomonadaceae bacterium]|nr:DNA polymerase III subunit epsilon [Sphingomonadaceae bacterium]